MADVEADGIQAFLSPADAAEAIHDLSMSQVPGVAAYGRLLKRVNHGYWEWIHDERERLVAKGNLGSPDHLLYAFIRAQASFTALCFGGHRASAVEPFAAALAEAYRQELASYLKAALKSTQSDTRKG